MLQALRKRYLGDRVFYRVMLAIAIPLVIQQGITNLVSMLDNLMVGGLGEIPLSGVSIVNQLINVFNLTLFGGLSAASIFGAQFFGVGDWKGMRDTFRFRICFGGGITLLAVVVFLCWGKRCRCSSWRTTTTPPRTLPKRSAMPWRICGLRYGD